MKSIFLAYKSIFHLDVIIIRKMLVRVLPMWIMCTVRKWLIYIRELEELGNKLYLNLYKDNKHALAVRSQECAKLASIRYVGIGWGETLILHLFVTWKISLYFYNKVKDDLFILILHVLDVRLELRISEEVWCNIRP
jgi:hypothetical protein